MDFLRTGLVTQVNPDGVWCEIPSLAPHHEFGPFEIGPFVLEVNDRVLLGQVSDTTEDMVVLLPLLMEYTDPVPANGRTILYFENEAALLSAGLTLVSGLTVWLDDEQRFDVYTDEPTAGWISIYGEKGGELDYPFGMKMGIGQPNPGGSIDVNGGLAADWLLLARVLFDPEYRWRVSIQGDMQWGSGSVAPDTTLSRANANGLQLVPGLGINIAPDANSRLKVQNTTAARKGIHVVSTSTSQSAAHVDVESHASASTAPAVSTRLTGESVARLVVASNGLLQWSDGANATDVSLQRANANGAQLNPGLGINTAPDVNSRLRISNTTATREGVRVVSTSSTQSAAHVSTESHASAGAAPAFSARLTGETQPRLVVSSNGLFSWSDGSAAADATLERGGVGWLKTVGGLDVGTFLDVAGTIDGAGDVYAQGTLFAGPTSNDMGRGLYVSALSTSDSSATSGTTELVLLTTASTTFYANRAYEIRYSQRFSQSVSTASTPFIFFRKTNVAGQQLCDMGREQLPANNLGYHFSGSCIFVVGGSNVTAAICQTITPSAATNITQKGTASFPRAFHIWDIGPAANHTGQAVLT
jgi:hypothetical protein